MDLYLKFLWVYTFAIITIASELVTSQRLYLGQQSSFSVKNDVNFNVDLEWDEKLTPSEQPTIVIETSFKDHSKSNFLNFVVLYGHNSEHWEQTGNGPSKVTLCIYHTNIHNFPTSLIIIAQNDRYASEIDVNILVKKENISLGIDEPRNVSISKDAPATFLITHSSRSNASRKDSLIINVDAAGELDRNICMAVSVYQQGKCPLKDTPENVRTADIWSTALDKSTTTVRTRNEFSESMYVSVMLLPDEMCREGSVTSDFIKGRNIAERAAHGKTITIQVKMAMPYKKYIFPILVGLVPMTILIIFSILVIIYKEYPEKPQEELRRSEKADVTSHDSNHASVENEANNHLTSKNGMHMSECLEDIDAPLPPLDELDKVEGLAPTSLTLMNENEIDGSIIERADKLWEEYQAINKRKSAGEGKLFPDDKVDTVIEKEELKKLEKKQLGLMRLKAKPMLSDMTTILNDDKWFRRNRSKVYLYLVPIITTFYFVPSIQYVLQTKQTEQMLGTQDLCYHNFRCSRPFWIFDDFNHIVSNISYALFGLFFMIIVKIKAHRLPEDHHPKYDHRTTTGTLQQLSIFYAMGFCLMAEGLFSVCYHVCPTNLSLQFDTTMMYVISVLCYVKIYQFRHPNAIQNAYSTFMILGILVLLEAVVLFSSSILVYLPFVIFYVILTTFLAFDLYYHGVGRIDWEMGKLLAKDIARKGAYSITHCNEENNSQYSKFMRYPGRFWFSSVFFIINIGYAIFVTIQKVKDGSKTITHVLLVILAGNMMLYLFYYIVQKTIENLKRKKLKKTQQGEENSERVKSKRRFLKTYPGPCFAIIALALGFVAIFFYTSRSANRNVTPAESRNLNADCKFFDFYGKFVCQRQKYILCLY